MLASRVALVAIAFVALTTVASARYLEPDDTDRLDQYESECDCDDAVADAIENYRSGVSVCLEKAQSLDDAKRCISAPSKPK